ncbi:nitrite reductase small subunit NirD [Reinekea thalattae]|uniref:Nitrite reductase small subunit NirD n=1 Tax=Reinekea thalattae TaxID=2593301 RepID=A0A5C8Z4K6_9GAMM|nr:nitrite reductase small subunit NirD [Reinekea thalattae]TXR52128.1 nitrite reductase small subunit NirD [Reinekea thalattae]
MSTTHKTWQAVCSTKDLIPYSGVAAKFDNQQVAIFYLPHLEPSVYAIGHFDPFSRANVLARGIVCDIKGQLCVASPLYKQHFSFLTGLCLEDENMYVPVWAAKIENQQVLLCQS